MSEKIKCCFTVVKIYVFFNQKVWRFGCQKYVLNIINDVYRIEIGIIEGEIDPLNNASTPK